MDTETLIQALRNLIPEEFEWKFALYSAGKSRDGLELHWNFCNMNDISLWINTLTAQLLEKAIPEHTVTGYSPFLPKENIGAILKTNDLIKEQISDIEASLQNALTYSPADFISGALPKISGYGFYGFKTDDDGRIFEKVLFMRRSNPFLSGTRIRLCNTDSNTVFENSSPLLKFTAGTDFLMISDTCYFFSAPIERDFSLEERHIAICGKRMKELANSNIISDFDRLEKIAYANRHARKFIDFDKNILDHICRLPLTERIEFLDTYGIRVDQEGRMDTSEDEQCELIIDLLCCRSCLDPLGRLAVGSKITVRE